jgi:hypothetical protein
MLPGMFSTVVGSDPARNYWLITVPGSPGAVCWLWGYYATVSGDISALPAAATFTPTGLVYSLSEPKNLSAACSAEPYQDDGDDEENDIDDASAWTVIFRWMNTEPNQQGVRVYRNNQRIATLSPGARSYTDYFIHYDYYHGARYGVQAYSGNAVSAIVWTYMNSCR